MNDEAKPIEKTVDTTASPRAVRKRSGWLPVFVLLGVFLLGFVPMWLKSTRLDGELFRAQREVRLQQIQIMFADAALDARRGEYESARRVMANFFTVVAAEMDRDIGSALPAVRPNN
jgi:hypothetical protein